MNATIFEWAIMPCSNDLRKLRRVPIPISMERHHIMRRTRDPHRKNHLPYCQNTVRNAVRTWSPCRPRGMVCMIARWPSAHVFRAGATRHEHLQRQVLSTMSSKPSTIGRTTSDESQQNPFTTSAIGRRTSDATMSKLNVLSDGKPPPLPDRMGSELREPTFAAALLLTLWLFLPLLATSTKPTGSATADTKATTKLGHHYNSMCA